jgi:YidC/Oxa1 family membrane protein insertase
MFSTTHMVEMFFQLALIVALIPVFRSTTLSTMQKGVLIGLLGALYAAVGWYFGPRDVQESPASVQLKPRVIENEQALVRPLLREFSFCEGSQGNECAAPITIETDLARIVFSSNGGVISQFACKRTVDGKPGELTIWKSHNESSPEAFLVALEEATPFAYQLISNQKDVARGKPQSGVHSVVFRAATASAAIEKEFVIYRDSYKIELFVTITPSAQQTVRPRIFVPAPVLEELPEDIVKAIVLADETRGSLEKNLPRDVEGRLWIKQDILGSEDRYFVSALIKDIDRFTERAYFDSRGPRSLVALFEGPEISKERTWKLEFYVGPKQASAFEKVDSRLLATLDYGWLKPICSSLMLVLQAIYRLVGNYGLAIILLTMLLKLALLPLLIRSDRTQRKMSELQRKLQALEKRYKNDPGMLEQEKIELMKRYGFSDMLLFGFVPQIAQALVFFGINRMLSVSIDLYRAPFFGWIHNLAATDPYYVFPILAGIGFFFFMRRMHDMRQIVMSAMMGLVIVAIMSNLAVGVVLFVCCAAWFDMARVYFFRREVA